MTTAGFQVFDASGKVQLDAVKPTLAIIAKGVTTPTADSGFGSGSLANKGIVVTVTAVNPIIAFACTNTVSVMRVSNSGSSWSFYLNCYFATADIHWWVFDTAPQFSTTDRFGLQLFDAAGNRTYHSSQGLFNPVDFLQISAPSTSLPWAGADGTGAVSSVTGTYTSGRTYAVVQSTLFNRYEEVIPSRSYGPNTSGHSWREYYNFWSCAKVSGNVVTGTCANTLLQHAEVLNPHAADTVSQYGAMNWLVLDVTNF